MALELLASSEPAVRDTAKRFANWRLFVLSSAALYLEIVLIRWLGTEVKIFAFFQNLSLIVCFLGFGVGCFTSSKRGSVLPSIAATTTLILAVNLPFNSWHVLLKTLSSVLSFTADAALWGNVNGLNSIVTSSSEYYEYLAISICVVATFLMLVSIAMIPWDAGSVIISSIRLIQLVRTRSTWRAASSESGSWPFSLSFGFLQLIGSR